MCPCVRGGPPTRAPRLRSPARPRAPPARPPLRPVAARLHPTPSTRLRFRPPSRRAPRAPGTSRLLSLLVPRTGVILRPSQPRLPRPALSPRVWGRNRSDSSQVLISRSVGRGRRRCVRLTSVCGRPCRARGRGGGGRGGQGEAGGRPKRNALRIEKGVRERSRGVGGSERGETHKALRRFRFSLPLSSLIFIGGPGGPRNLRPFSPVPSSAPRPTAPPPLRPPRPPSPAPSASQLKRREGGVMRGEGRQTATSLGLGRFGPDPRPHLGLAGGRAHSPAAPASGLQVPPTPFPIPIPQSPSPTHTRTRKGDVCPSR